MDWITESIAIGNIDDAMHRRALSGAGISAVLGLNEYPTFLDEWGFAWRRVQLVDGPGNSADVVRSALDVLDEFLLNGHRVLVHCTEGVSRAPFVIACHLAMNNDWDFDRALTFIAGKRTVANPHPALRSLWPVVNTYPRNNRVPVKE